MPTLADLINSPGVHHEGDFVSDAHSRVEIATLLPSEAQRSPVEWARGRTVVLALPDQLSAVGALIHLDGVAKRICLCPSDVAHTQLDQVVALAGADHVVTTWPRADQSVSLPDSPGPGRESATEWVLFTSGTTGRPKMIVHTLQTLAGHLAGRGLSSRARPVWATFYDIHRYGGLQVLLRALTCGASLVLSSSGEAPAEFLKRCASAGATHFVGTASHWRRALMTEARRDIRPDYVRLSGEVADQAILDRLRATYPNAAIVHAFASTEAGLAFEVSDGKAGFPASLVHDAGGVADLRVDDDTLRIRSTRLSHGKLDTTLVGLCDEDGFIDTGDVVHLHEGRYFFAGRRDGVINVGGLKVHPEEVEAVVNQHPFVQMSMVRGRPSPVTGAIVVADVVVRADADGGALAHDGSSVDLKSDIRQFCRARLAAHKVPTTIRLVPSLAIAPTGKLVRTVA